MLSFLSVCHPYVPLPLFVAVLTASSYDEPVAMVIVISRFFLHVFPDAVAWERCWYGQLLLLRALERVYVNVA